MVGTITLIEIWLLRNVPLFEFQCADHSSQIVWMNSREFLLPLRDSLLLRAQSFLEHFLFGLSQQILIFRYRRCSAIYDLVSVSGIADSAFCGCKYVASSVRNRVVLRTPRSDNP